jgi:nucleoside-diphosphate-sugar epimerase
VIATSGLCLVTGGAGFIGSNLVRSLVSDGTNVRVLDDLSTGRAQNLRELSDAVQVRIGDVRNAEDVAAAIDGVDTVFHLAAIPSVARSVGDPASSNDVNVTGTLNVLLAARDAGCRRVVLASSSAVYGRQPTMPLHEQMVCAPVSPYGVTKLAGERYMKAFFESYGLPTVSLRFFNVFGPGQNPLAEYAAVVPRFIRASLQGEPVTIFGDGTQTRDLVYVGDVVAACRLAADAPAEALGGAFNVATGESHTVGELHEAIARLAPEPGPDPIPAPPRPGDVTQSQADISLARSVLGYAPSHTFEQGLGLTFDWFFANASLL